MPRKSRSTLITNQPRRTAGSDDMHDRQIANLGAALHAAWQVHLDRLARHNAAVRVG